MLRSTLTDPLKMLLYATGLLGLYHRLRNARSLTVVMFHRVLDPNDPRWLSCDPDYTISADLFRHCLVFLRANYNIVSAEDVLQARRRPQALPARALLITFDDGWADTVEFALPVMQALGVPGLTFVVSDAIDRPEPFFQERLFGAWRRGRLPLRRLVQALRDGGAEPGPAHPVSADEQRLRSLIATVENLTPPQRSALLTELAPELAPGPEGSAAEMVSTLQLQSMPARGMAIGSHGKTHLPLTHVADLATELNDSRQRLAACLAACQPTAAAPATLSFPHGRFDPLIAAQVRQAGFELVFTSVPALNRVRPQLGWLLARVGVVTEAAVDARGRFRPDRLALHLFRRPHRTLA